MTEAVYNQVQFGRQANIATAVAATTVFPVDAGFLGFELDRASESSDEDFGNSDREQTGRESTGLRLATASLPFVGRFQDIMHALEMHVAGTSGTPGSGTAVPSVYTHTYDSTSDTLIPYTIEYGVKGSTQDEWEARGVIANDFEFGFDALSAPGNSMWKGTLGLVALDRVPAALTSALTPPATLETMEGHLTTLAEGPVGTAFASLTALAGIKQFSFRSNINAVARAYGGSTDIASRFGRSGKGEVEYDALVAISSAAKASLIDIYEAAGSVVTERRWRVAVTGSGTNGQTIDFRTRFRAVNVGDHEGERLYAVNGVWVRDATLAGRGQFKTTNGVTVIP